MLIKRLSLKCDYVQLLQNIFLLMPHLYNLGFSTQNSVLLVSASMSASTKLLYLTNITINSFCGSIFKFIIERDIDSSLMNQAAVKSRLSLGASREIISPRKKTNPAIYPAALQPFPDELPRAPFDVKLEQGKRDRAGPPVQKDPNTGTVVKAAGQPVQQPVDSLKCSVSFCSSEIFRYDFC